MGLLEDAIREHLELKRLRGADPSEVAREQQEALDAPSAAEPDASVVDALAATGYASDAGAEAADGGSAVEGPAATPEDDMGVHVGEETAELDMEAVLAQHPGPSGETGDPPEHAQGRIPAEPSEEDSLEWEVPDRAHDADASGPVEEEAREGGAGAEQQRSGHAGGEDRHARAEENAPGQGRLSF